MRLSNTCLICLVAIACSILFFTSMIVYVSYFTHPINTTQEELGAFGDFIGGVFNPLFSIIAFLTALWAIFQQKQDSKQNHEAFTLEKNRDDLYKLIIKISTRVNETYNGEYLPNKHSIHKAMMGKQDAAKNASYKELVNGMNNKNSETYSRVKYIIDDLEKLSSYLNEYKRLSHLKINCSSYVVEFYRSEYKQLVAVFYREKWIDQKIYKFYVEESNNN